MSCPSWQWHRTGSRWSPVRTLPLAPLWRDLGFVPYSRDDKASATQNLLRPPPYEVTQSFYLSALPRLYLKYCFCKNLWQDFFFCKLAALVNQVSSTTCEIYNLFSMSTGTSYTHMPVCRSVFVKLELS